MRNIFSKIARFLSNDKNLLYPIYPLSIGNRIVISQNKISFQASFFFAFDGLYFETLINSES